MQLSTKLRDLLPPITLFLQTAPPSKANLEGLAIVMLEANLEAQLLGDFTILKDDSGEYLVQQRLNHLVELLPFQYGLMQDEHQEHH
ncbi:hypothetical protein PCC6912_31260 [Chlorogloeopsis fritschii PCC 6912]|uniref:Uncharacterized protein n=1 Tax=Chlorogloeopsis fritschii PCC 6912 TaxID=211165 RepID=A0A3S0ZUP7_CHLFR|nr:hypothetical protein PCC6912_31260 [Chlorogloeopsis fritschii PCC 6912]